MQQDLDEYLESKCYEILSAKDFYEDDKKEFLKYVEKLEESDFYMKNINEKAIQMQRSFYSYKSLDFVVKQFCYAAGNEEIYKRIVGESEG